MLVMILGMASLNIFLSITAKIRQKLRIREPGFVAEENPFVSPAKASPQKSEAATPLAKRVAACYACLSVGGAIYRRLQFKEGVSLNKLTSFSCAEFTGTSSNLRNAQSSSIFNIRQMVDDPMGIRILRRYMQSLFISDQYSPSRLWIYSEKRLYSASEKFRLKLLNSMCILLHR